MTGTRWRFILSLVASILIFPAHARPIGEMGQRLGLTRLSSAAEGNHTCMVPGDGTIRCWGDNQFGQLGNGTSGNTSNIPVAVIGISSAIAVAAGANHTCALLANGTVRCWGTNADGQLGLGQGTASALAPTAIAGLNGVTALSAGTAHTCARISNGTMRCWGSNQFGQIGDGTGTGPRFTPTVVQNVADAVTVTAGPTFTCATRASGIASCWGGNSQGHLGVGNFAQQNFPTNVLNLPDLPQISLGAQFSCGRRANGDLYCWGRNNEGQAGTGTTGGSANTPQLIPVQSPDGERIPILKVSTGAAHACAMAFDGIGEGHTLCWGRNTDGQVGRPPSNFEAAPRFLAGQGISISAGSRHTCRLERDESVRCWGANALGQLGTSNNIASSTPQLVFGLRGSISARGIAAGTNHTCALRSSAQAACWGRNLARQLGDGTGVSRLVPTSLAFILQLATLAAGGDHTCAMGTAGAVPLCWGDNRNGQANPTSSDDFINLSLSTASFGEPGAVNVVAGSLHGCELTAGGTLSCRGSNAQGRLGNSDTAQHFISDVGGITNATAVVTGGGQSCALLGNGRVSCWGLNSSGELGDGNQNSNVNATPRLVLGLTDAVALSAGRNHTCALRSDGTLACWGSNDHGQVDGGNANRLIPVAVPGVAVGDAVAVAAGTFHTCYLTAAGGVRCWGDNDEGQLGNNTTTDSNAPVQVLRGLLFVKGVPATFGSVSDVAGLVAGAGHTCAQGANGAVRCWGDNSDGQIGDNTGGNDRLIATTVGSFTTNIVPEATVDRSGRTGSVDALVNCEPGARFEVVIHVAQDAAQAHGQAVGECAEGLIVHPVHIAARGVTRLREGSAHARAEIVVKRQGDLLETQTWQRSVQFSRSP